MSTVGETIDALLAEQAAVDAGRQLTLTGLIKQAASPGDVAFSIDGCAHWVTLPRSAISVITPRGRLRCGDHAHPVVGLTLRRPEQGGEIFDLLVSVMRAAAKAHARMMAVQSTAAPAGDAARHGPAPRDIGRTLDCIGAWLGGVDPWEAWNAGICPPMEPDERRPVEIGDDGG